MTCENIDKKKAEIYINMLKQISHNYKANPTLKAYGEACLFAVECVKKQIANPVIVKEIDISGNKAGKRTSIQYSCASCGCLLNIRRKRECCDCGQRLDWKGVL